MHGECADLTTILRILLSDGRCRVFDFLEFLMRWHPARRGSRLWPIEGPPWWLP